MVAKIEGEVLRGIISRSPSSRDVSTGYPRFFDFTLTPFVYGESIHRSVISCRYTWER